MIAGTLSPGVVHLPGGIYAANGARIIPVHHSGPGNLEDAPSWWATDGRASVNDALPLCRSGRGDIIQLLPGHLETIDAADKWSNLAATGVTVLGPSWGPPATIRWTAAAATVLMDTADFVIDGGPTRNLRLEMAGDLASTTALTVAAPITASAARCAIRRTWGSLGVDADQLVTDALSLTAAADYFKFENNLWIGQAGAVITTAIKTTAAGCDYLEINDNTILAEVATAATGILLDLDAGAILMNMILRNRLFNMTASSKYVLDPHASSTGLIDGNVFYTLDGATAPASSAIAATTTQRVGLNYCTTAQDASAILCPAADL